MHRSVLLEEVIEYLSPKSNGIYVDATLGAGGHSQRILEQSAPDGKVVGIDADPFMLKIAREKLIKFKKRIVFVEGNFVNTKNILEELNIGKVDGIVFDLGVSSYHFEIPERGFSIKREGPLDMRLNSGNKITAEYIVNNYEYGDLVDIFFRYGEESRAKIIAGAIIQERKKNRIATTTQLAGLIEKKVSYKSGKTKLTGYRLHPATRVFQALRIAVNDELENLRNIIPVSVSLLTTGGRLCVISFHSLEDRIVKRIFRSLSKGCVCPPEIPVCVCGRKPSIRVVTKKPIISNEQETAGNPRARSAKLRVAEKI